jgi:hypothetical protein
MLNVFNLKEAKPLKCFDPKGLFYVHLLLMRYINIFIRISEGIDDNDPNTSRKKEKKTCNDDFSIKVNSNTQRQQNRMNKN